MASELVCPRCQSTRCIRNGSSRSPRRFACQDCGRAFAATVVTPLFRLHTPLAEIVRSILIVLRRGSVRAAEEQTGHNYETIADWIRRIGEHAGAVTEVFAHDLELSDVEVDEFGPFVSKKRQRTSLPRGRAILPVRPPGLSDYPLT